MLARSVIKWNKACGKKLARWISHFNQSKNYRQNCSAGDKGTRFANLDYLRTLLSPEIARFQINFRRSVMRNWITNICSKFLDVQETNSRVSQQGRIRNHFSARGFEHGRYTSITIVGLCIGNIVGLRCKWKPNTSKSQTSFVISSLDHLIWLTTFQATFQRVDSQPGFAFSRTTKQSFV